MRTDEEIDRLIGQAVTSVNALGRALREAESAAPRSAAEIRDVAAAIDARADTDYRLGSYEEQVGAVNALRWALGENGWLDGIVPGPLPRDRQYECGTCGSHVLTLGASDDGLLEARCRCGHRYVPVPGQEIRIET